MGNFEEKDRNPNKSDKSMGSQGTHGPEKDRNKGQQNEPGRESGTPREGQGGSSSNSPKQGNAPSSGRKSGNESEDSE